MKFPTLFFGTVRVHSVVAILASKCDCPISYRLGVLPGANAASEAEVRKRNHYSDLPSTVIFEPVAMETLGGAGRSTAVFLKELARRITVLTGEKLAFKFLKQKLDLAIQRGNAGCILEATS